MPLSNYWRRLIGLQRDEQGSATVESMLIFPLIMLVILILLLIAVYGYQAVYIQYVTQTAADRASYNWDARERSIRTAQLESDNYYGLYEHELSIVLLKSWIALADNIKQQEMFIVSNRFVEPEGRLIIDRLAQTQNYIASTSNSLNGKLMITRKGFIPVVSVHLRKQISPLVWQQQQLLPSPFYSTEHDIYAPTQFIRNVDLFLYYFDKFSSLNHEQKQARKNKGGKAVKLFSS